MPGVLARFAWLAMSTLIHQRCYHHPLREAAARCPDCRRYFCRECVVEHEQRVLCAACLRKLAGGGRASQHWRVSLGRAVSALSGFLLLWLIFYLVGQMLLAIPSSFHEGTVWQQAWSGEP